MSNVTCDGTSNGDVWYKLIVPSSGKVTIETNAGTINDMGMAVYSGSCSSLSYIGCYANGSSYSQYMPKAALTGLTPNSTLWVRLWEYNNNNFGTFSICATTTSAALAVTYPNGGETLNKGTNYNITWNSSNVTGNIQIDLYKGSTNVLQLAAGASNTGSYSFTPPASLTDGNDYRIGISGMSGTVSDFSNTYFSISTKVTSTLTVTYPNGGETLNKGTNYAITWNSSSVTGNIQIDLYKGSTNVLQLAAGASNTGSYSFTPPTSLTDGNDYRIGISGMSGTVSDFSNAYFAIATPVNTDCLAPSSPATCTTSIGDIANGLEHKTNLSCDIVSGADGYFFEYSFDGTTWNADWGGNPGYNWVINLSDSPNLPVYYRVRSYECDPIKYSESYTYASPQPIYTACDDAAAPIVNSATLNSLNITLNAETPVENPSYTTYSIYCSTTSQYVQSNGILGTNEVFQTKIGWGTKTVTGLLNNKEYCFYAKARNNDGDVRYNSANSVCATTLQGTTPIPAPVALPASGITQTGFTANWNASSTATGYRLDIATDNTFVSFVAGYNNKDVGNVITLPVTGLTAGTTYYYRLKAYNTSTTSDVSNIINVKTLSPDATTIAIGNTSGSAGTTVSIPVSAKKFLDVVGFQFTIDYDKTKLDYVNCTNWSGGTNVSDIMVTPLVSDGKVTFIYNNTAINIAEGKFFDLNFTIKTSATGSAALSWSDNPTIREISNSQSNEIPCNYNNGVLTIVTGYNLSGQLLYENTAQTALNNISINLLNSNSQSVGSSITEATGIFTFPGLSNGNYIIKPDVESPWGGASAMDITSYKKHIGNINTLSQIQVKSGDVNGSNSLTSMDLTIIKQRIGAQISSFTTGDWVYDPISAIINGTNLIQNIKALCYGDANGSYSLSTLKSSSNIFLAGNEKISLLSNGEFEIPFILSKSVDKLSSVTLSLNYSSELFDVKDIKMIAHNEDLYYSVKGGKINVVYSTLNSLSLKEGDALMTIQFSLKKDASQAITNDNHLGFSGSGEFGDFDDKVLEDIKLLYSAFDFNTLIDEFRKDGIKVYPNPATNLLTVTNVNNTKINVLDMLGRSLLSVHCQSNSIDLNISSLIPGTYTLKVNKNNEIIYRKFTVVK